MKYKDLLGFPLVNKKKVPAIKEWQAQDEYRTLGNIITQNKGVVCGRPNRLLVVDCDVKGVKNGIEQFTKLMREFGYENVPETLTVSTPSGGIHYYFYLPESALDLRKQPREDLGIDFQAGGAYVVGVGSYHDDTEHDGQYAGSYEVALNKPIIEAPAKLVDWLLENTKTFEKTGNGELNRSLRVFFSMLEYESGRLGSEQWLLNQWAYKLRKNTNLDNGTIERALTIIYSYIYGTEPDEIKHSKAKGLVHSNALSRFLNELVFVRYDEGGRNNALARVAGMLCLGTNDYNLYEWVCRMYMNVCFKDNLEEEEFQTTVRSIWKREKGRN